MASKYDPVEVAESIARFGYFDSEPMIVIPADVEGGPAGQFIVVEGNRRLAAITLLRDPDLAGAIDPDREGLWRKLAESDKIPSEVPVVTANSREEVAPLVGFRHISGIQPWEPWAKARFVTQLIGRHEGDFALVAEAVGETETAVRSLYRNFLLLEVAEGDYDVDVRPVKDSFGVFTRAMTSIPIRTFVGVPAPRDVEYENVAFQTENPENVRNFFLWVFGAEGREPIIGESRRVQDQLPAVLGSEEAVAILEATGEFSEAVRAAGGYLARLTQSLIQALNALEAARQDMAEYADDEEVRQLLEDCRAALESLEDIGRAEVEE